MGISIQEGQSLRTIENNISEVVSECEYWGDLDLTWIIFRKDKICRSVR